MEFNWVHWGSKKQVNYTFLPSATEVNRFRVREKITCCLIFKWHSVAPLWSPLKEFTGKFNFRNWQFIKYERTSVLRATQTLVLEALDIWKNVHRLWYFCPSQKWRQQTRVDNEQSCTENCKHNHSLHPTPADSQHGECGGKPPSDVWAFSHMCTKWITRPWGSTQSLLTFSTVYEDCLWTLSSWFMCR